jgi:hypothetical protein
MDRRHHGCETGHPFLAAVLLISFGWEATTNDSRRRMGRACELRTRQGLAFMESTLDQLEFDRTVRLSKFPYTHPYIEESRRQNKKSLLPFWEQTL